MLQIVIILGWLIAFGLMMYLATQAIKHRLHGLRQRRPSARKFWEFKKRNHFDAKRQRWMRNLDEVALVDEAGDDRRFVLAVLGWLLLALWEGYWLYEIVERFFKSTQPWQLPYVFLFFILVVLPLAVYLFFWRRIRR